MMVSETNDDNDREVNVSNSAKDHKEMSLESHGPRSSDTKSKF